MTYKVAIFHDDVFVAEQEYVALPRPGDFIQVSETDTFLGWQVSKIVLLLANDEGWDALANLTNSGIDALLTAAYMDEIRERQEERRRIDEKEKAAQQQYLNALPIGKGWGL